MEAYTSESHVSNEIARQSEFHQRVDYSLFLFMLITVTYIILGWNFDKRHINADKPDKERDRKGNDEDLEEEGIGFFEQVYRGKFFNGYIMSFSVWIIAIILSQRLHIFVNGIGHFSRDLFAMIFLFSAAY